MTERDRAARAGCCRADHRRLAAAQQGDRRPQRLRPRGGHPPARRAGQPADLRDHDARLRRAWASRAWCSASTPAGTRCWPACEALGLALSASQVDDLTARVKELADRQEVRLRRRPRWRSLRATARGPSAAGALPDPFGHAPAARRPRWRSSSTAQQRSASAVGNGPLDAAAQGHRRGAGAGAGAARGAHPRRDRRQGRAGRSGRARAPRGRRVDRAGGQHRHARGHPQGLRRRPSAARRVAQAAA